MRAAFDICQPSGYLGEEESALAQCFMAVSYTHLAIPGTLYPGGIQGTESLSV